MKIGIIELLTTLAALEASNKKETAEPKEVWAKEKIDAFLKELKSNIKTNGKDTLNDLLEKFGTKTETESKTLFDEIFEDLEKTKAEESKKKQDQIALVLSNTKKYLDKVIGRELVPFSTQTKDFRTIGVVAISEPTELTHSPIFKGLGIIFIDGKVHFYSRTKTHDVIYIYQSLEGFIYGETDFVGLKTVLTNEVEKGAIK